MNQPIKFESDETCHPQNNTVSAAIVPLPFVELVIRVDVLVEKSEMDQIQQNKQPYANAAS